MPPSRPASIHSGPGHPNGRVCGLTCIPGARPMPLLAYRLHPFPPARPIQLVWRSVVEKKHHCAKTKRVIALHGGEGLVKTVALVFP